MLMLNMFISICGKGIYFIILTSLHFSTLNHSLYLLGSG